MPIFSCIKRFSLFRVAATQNISIPLDKWMDHQVRNLGQKSRCGSPDPVLCRPAAHVRIRARGRQSLLQSERVKPKNGQGIQQQRVDRGALCERFWRTFRCCQPNPVMPVRGHSHFLRPKHVISRASDKYSLGRNKACITQRQTIRLRMRLVKISLFGSHDDIEGNADKIRSNASEARRTVSDHT